MVTWRSLSCNSRPESIWLALCTAGLMLCIMPGLITANPPRTSEASPPHLAADPKQQNGQGSHHGQHTGSSEIKVTGTIGQGPVRVETASGSFLINQSTRGPNPYPGCLLCHGEIENATINMIPFELDCTFCHGGDPNALTQEDAHVHPDGTGVYDNTVPPIDEDLEYQRFVNPSNLRVLDETCGQCHPSHAADVVKSMMATAAGHYAGGLYQNGVVDTKSPIYGTFAVTDDDGDVPVERGAVQSLQDLLIFDPDADPSLVSTHFAAVPSQACARCHLWSRGKGYRGAPNADGVYRADGCVACHMLYGNDGLSHSSDTSIDHSEPGHPRQHVITKQIPTEQCLHCHHRGARIGLNFTGRAQMPPRLPSGPGVPGTTDVRFNSNFHYTDAETNPPDVHHQAGMHCIDCHIGSEIMGDGNIWGHMDQATKIECQSCHGMPHERPTMVDNDGAAIPNLDSEGELTLISKVDGVRHVVPRAIDIVDRMSPRYNARAACAMNDNHLSASGGLECYACHASWVPNCFGCHFERDEREVGLNLMTRQPEVGRVRTSNKIFEAMRQFSIGPNSEGRVAPYLVACQPIADVTAPDGSKILDFVMPVTANGLSGLAHNPVNPHTVRGAGEVRTCAECHRSPPTLGFGSGNYSIARTRIYTAGDTGVSLYNRDADPARPAPDGSLPMTPTAKAIASVPNVVEGNADYLCVAAGTDGVAIYDRRPGAPTTPVEIIGAIDAIDISRAAGYLYVIDRGVGVRVYDNSDPETATFMATIPIPTANRAVPWGIHLFVAAGTEGLVVVSVADHAEPAVVGSARGINAVDVQLYSHYQGGSGFATRAYVADPGYGVHVVDLLPDFDAPRVTYGLPLPDGAFGLDTYTRYVLATATEPSREHDYLYAAAGTAGLRIFDITNPDGIFEVGDVTDLGGFVADVDVASQLAPPGVDDYAIIANELAGLQVVGVNDPTNPVTIGTVVGSTGASRVLVEVQQMDRYLDEQGVTLKENSHPFTSVFSREDIVRILSASIDCVTACPSDFDGTGVVDVGDILSFFDAWFDRREAADCDASGMVDIRDLLAYLECWFDGLEGQPCR